MKYTLIFYTHNWEFGPSIELEETPATGSVVWINNKRERYEHDMYYVDNVMHADLTINNEHVIYLFVRPYTGYSKYAPKTESDRLAENIGKLVAEQCKTNEFLEQACRSLDALNSSLDRYEADTDDRNEDVAERLKEIIYALETIAERVE